MKKNLLRSLLVFVSLLFAIVPFYAQQVKMDARLQQMLKKYDAAESRAMGNKSPISGVQNPISGDNSTLPVLNILIKAQKGKALPLQEHLLRLGFTAKAVNGDMVTAKIPIDRMEDVAACQDVKFMYHSRKFRLLNDKTREETGVDNAHNAVELSTPFTGKGVVVGIVDEGFEFNHVAFQHNDGSSRVLSVWDQSKEGDVPSDVATDNSDSFPEAGGHATHVAGIAAGSVVSGLDYHGMAPEAELVLVASDFDQTNVLDALHHIDTLATNAGKPWVTNFSFGGHDGPHDGTDAYSEAVNTFLGEGKLLVAAMGNENGDNLHTSYDFKEQGETVDILLRKSSDGLYFNIWSNAADSLESFEFRPYIYKDGTKDYKTSSFWEDIYYTGIEESARKQYMYFNCGYSDIPAGANIGIEVKSLRSGGFHAWIEAEFGSYVTQQSGTYLTGDNDYLVCEGGATVHRAIAVGSYNARNSLKNINGSTISYGFYYPIGEVSSFSNAGPSLSDEVIPKPTIAAPGVLIVSAMNQYSDSFSSSSSSNITKTQRNGNTYYYSHKSGTSMATPAVTGILALWLQAFPTMTPEQANEIMRATAKTDSYTTDPNYWGYGKIDAYEGLKKAIAMNDSITLGMSHLTYEVAHTPTLLFTPDRLRILWADQTAEASLTVYDMSGKAIINRQLGAHRAGEESHTDLSALDKGVYLLNIRTPYINISRKIRK